MKLFLLPMVVFVLTSCAPQPPPSPKSSPAQPPKNQPAPTAPKSLTQVQPPARLFDESLLRGKEYLLQAGSGGHPEIQDYDLGKLTSDSVLRDSLEQFFREADDGVLDESRVAPRWSAYLNQWAAGMKGKLKAGGTFRIGPVRVDDGVLTVPVRSRSAEGGFFGWAAVERDGSRYRVSDVQISEAAPRTVSFDPESPQEISSPNRR